LAQGKENYTLKGEEFLQIYGSHVKSETLDSCIFETKMHQNAPNPISISIFSGGHPRTPATGGSAQTPGEEREGRVRNGRAGQGKGMDERGRRGKGRGGGSLRHCCWGDRRPWIKEQRKI